MSLYHTKAVPNITTSQDLYITTETTEVTFQCKASGSPSPIINWYKNENILLMSSDSRITVGPVSEQILTSGLHEVVQNLTIINTTSSDSGNYSCLGNNIAGSQLEAFKLIVWSKLI